MRVIPPARAAFWSAVPQARERRFGLGDRLALARKEKAPSSRRTPKFPVGARGFGDSQPGGVDSQRCNCHVARATNLLYEGDKPAEKTIVYKILIAQGTGVNLYESMKITLPPIWLLSLVVVFNSGVQANNTNQGRNTQITGGTKNSIAAAVTNSVIAGGQNNKVSAGANNAVIAGGARNVINAAGERAFIAGGQNNLANGAGAFAAGNRAQARHGGTFVWGDGQTAIFQSTATNQFLIRAQRGVGINTNNPRGNALSVLGNTLVTGNLRVTGSINGRTNFVGPAGPQGPPGPPGPTGGLNPTITGSNAYVGGGEGNTASTFYTTVGGGLQNTASGASATVSGGGFNNASGGAATVGGGGLNIASGEHATVGGGYGNEANGEKATVGGGWVNRASGSIATVGGGLRNRGSGLRATVGGGEDNTAAGSYSTVPGGVRGKASNIGSFVWGGDNDEDTESFGPFTFTVRCSGGARFYTAKGTGTGVSLAAGGGAWNNLSDRDAKANFQKVSATDVLAKVATLPVMTWNYTTQDESIRHIGPTAQDFRAAFGLGESDKTISTIDPSGVALAAIQGLVEEIKLRDEKIAELEAWSREQGAGNRAEIEMLKAELKALREEVRSNLPPAP